MKYNPEINRLRGVAILLTIFAHASIDGHAWKFLRSGLSGNGGVILFFVISGFVISASLGELLGKNSAVTASIIFWIKRFTRIFPQAFLWVVIGSLIAVAQHFLEGTNDLVLTFKGAIAALTNVYNFFILSVNKSTVFMPYWSLSQEEQFYIIFPFFLVFLPLTKDRLWTLAAALMALNLLSPWERRWFAPEGIILGVAWYEIWKRIDLPFGNMSRLYSRLGFAFVITLLMMAEPFLGIMQPNVFYLIMPMISLVFVSLASLRVGFVPESKLLEWCGKRSYALYLAHVPIILLGQTLRNVIFIEMGSHKVMIRTIVSLLAIGLSVLMAEVSYRYIEQPIRRKGRDCANSLASPNNSVD